jgi:uncharacterized protein YqjF (DUF2071 family)
MSTFLTAEWRKLIMAQYAVDPAVLAPWLPRGVELDLFEDRCYVSLVGFLFDRVRIKGVPPPFHTRFEEVNLRFYVRRLMPDGAVRRGVVFISEIVPKLAITFIARTFYGENYETAATSRIWRIPEAGGRDLDISYSWRLPGGGARSSKTKWQHLAVQAAPLAQAIPQGSVEEFLTEHYWGYTKHPDGSTSEYGVEHPRWEIYPVRAVQVAADFGALYGKVFGGLSEREPDNVLLAEGSAITVRKGNPMKA